MTIKNLNQILREIMREGKKNPGEWRALAAPTKDRSGSDLLLFHPSLGPIYQLRAYEKNPYQIHGFGTRISQQVDEDFLNLIENQKTHGNLGILDLNFQLLRKAMDEGVKLDKILFDAILGNKDKGMDFLDLGPSYHSPLRSLPSINEAQKKLDKEYERMLKREGKTKMYG